VVRAPRRRRLARHRARELAAVAADGPLRAPSGTGPRLLARRRGRRARDTRRGPAELRALPHGHGAVRHCADVEPPGTLRGGRHQSRRAARPRDGPDRLGLRRRLDRRPDPHGPGHSRRRRARRVVGGQRVSDLRRRVRAGGDARAGAPAARSARHRATARAAARDGRRRPAGTPDGDNSARAAGDRGLRHADGQPARDDRHHVDLAASGSSSTTCACRSRSLPSRSASSS